jgi:hypothetical protein
MTNTMTNTTSKRDRAYAALEEADSRFQAAVIKQYGHKNAGTMRYCTDLHNPETRAAAEEYWTAADVWRGIAR